MFCCIMLSAMDIHLYNMMLAVFSLLLLLPASHAYEKLSVSACFNTDQRILQLDCKEREMVRIHRVFYGHSSSGQCAYKEGDCIVNDNLHYSCIGRQSCQINLPSGGRGQRLSGCKQDSNYLQAEYECIPSSEVYDICSHKKFTSQTGYIMTPRYPHNYTKDNWCETNIEVHRSQRLTLYVLDFVLPKPVPPGGCTDDLHVKTNLRDMTVCGPRQLGQLLGHIHNEMTLVFRSDGQVQNKGFWLYYEANPPIEITTPGVTESVSRTQVHETQQNAEIRVNQTSHGADLNGNHDIKQSPGNSSLKENRIPIESVTGAAAGLLAIVLAALVLVLCVQRRNGRCSRDQHSHPGPETSVNQVNNDLTHTGKIYTDV